MWSKKYDTKINHNADFAQGIGLDSSGLDTRSSSVLQYKMSQWTEFLPNDPLCQYMILSICHPALLAALLASASDNHSLQVNYCADDFMFGYNAQCDSQTQKKPKKTKICQHWRRRKQQQQPPQTRSPVRCTCRRTNCDWCGDNIWFETETLWLPGPWGEGGGSNINLLLRYVINTKRWEPSFISCRVCEQGIPPAGGDKGDRYSFTLHFVRYEVGHLV